MKRILLSSLLALSVTSCSATISNNTNQYSDLEQEYSQFKTKALTQAYLKRKMDKWLSNANYSKQLVREIEYAKYKHKDLLKDIVALQPTMFNDIVRDTGVANKRNDTGFETYIQYINPFPSAVTALDATNITSSSFTANWNAVSNATGYKLFVNGIEVYSGNDTSFNVTNLTPGSSYNYYVQASNISGTSASSTARAVTLKPAAPVATSATNITQTSFTANWTAVSGATSYNLYIDGVLAYTGTNLSYEKTGLAIGSAHSYYVKAVNASGESTNSNTISVSTFLLSVLQTISVPYLTGSKFFEIGTDKFLAIVSSNVKVLKWNGTNFEDYQTFENSNFNSIEFFEIETNKYLIIGNYGLVGTGYVDNSKIYRWNANTNKFDFFQNIQTAGACDGQHFKIGTNDYIVFANANNNNSWNINSVVYKWNGTNFVFHQNIFTYAGVSVKKVSAGGNDFLAFAFLSENSGGGSWYATSYIYKWNTSTNLFEYFQGINTAMATEVDTFQIGTDVYIVYANRWNGGYSTNSVIYKWNGTSFASYQNIPSVGGFDIDYFEVGGDKYLGVANYTDGYTYSLNSYIYKYNPSTLKFDTASPFMNIPTNAIRSLEHFRIDNKDYIFFSSSAADNSIIYKLK